MIRYADNAHQFCLVKLIQNEHYIEVKRPDKQLQNGWDILLKKWITNWKCTLENKWKTLIHFWPPPPTPFNVVACYFENHY